MFNLDPDQVKSVAKNNSAFLLSARFWTATVLFRMGDEGYLLEVKNGAFVDFKRDDAAAEGDISISGPADSWSKLLQTVPPPGFQDPLFSIAGSGFEIKGDSVTQVAPYFHTVQEFIEVLREVRSGPNTEKPQPRVERDFDDAVGRYMYVDIEGVQYRIYYEEAGQGEIPLLLQHTAGADSRQWRHVLEDPDYQKLYRIICYDLPFHGRSLPPASTKWWEAPYKLHRSFLMNAVIGISKKLGLDRPVYMGCSIGGNLAPDLAYYHPQEFRAVIGLNGGLGSKKAYPEFWELWSHPRVGAQWTMGLIRSNTAPTSPVSYRRETTWVYSQCAPTINEGDMTYQGYEHDLTAEQAAQIDTSRLGVYLLTGAYDGLAFGGTAELANAIKGCHFQILPGLGHFGPAENPEGLKPYLLPILREIADAKVPTPAC